MMSGLPRPVRAPVIAGNWKMHMGPGEAAAFFREFVAFHSPREDRSILFFPPAIAFAAALEAIRERPDLALGLQNIHWEAQGAFTGETSALMAAAAGAGFALAGHSERRHLFGESDADVRRKVAAALDAGLVPVICVGETLEQRQADQVEAVLARQLDAALDGLAPDRVARILVAYEPVWAIGTGVNATPADASAAHAFLRGRLAAVAPEAGAVPILYGGSVKPDNAGDLLAAAAVDGLLVGGASLDPAGFARIASA
jgi:triosephosphate isomerase (TIM)